MERNLQHAGSLKNRLIGNLGSFPHWMILGKWAFMPCNLLEPPYNGVFLQLLNVIHNLVVRHDLLVLVIIDQAHKTHSFQVLFSACIVIFNCCSNSRPVLLSIILFSEECPANQIRSINKWELIEPSLKLPILIHHLITFLGTRFYDGRGLIILPTWWINLLVWLQRIKSSSNIGLVYNLLCIISEDHVSHGMSHMFTDPNKTPTPFSRVGRKTNIIQLEVHRFPPSKTEKRANIRRGTSQYFHWCAQIEQC
jgi:hypothetical protein